jgi:hypothetical protein
MLVMLRLLIGIAMDLRFHSRLDIGRSAPRSEDNHLCFTPYEPQYDPQYDLLYFDRHHGFVSVSGFRLTPGLSCQAELSINYSILDGLSQS